MKCFDGANVLFQRPWGRTSSRSARRPAWGSATACSTPRQTNPARWVQNDGTTSLRLLLERDYHIRSNLCSGCNRWVYWLFLSFQWWVCFVKKQFMNKSLSAPGQWTSRDPQFSSTPARWMDGGGFGWGLLRVAPMILYSFSLTMSLWMLTILSWCLIQ